MAEIITQNLEVSYQLPNGKNVQALKRFSSSFHSGSFSLVSGPSGCGKSTLLKTLAGLLPYEGSIRWGDNDFADLSFKNLNASYISQELVLYPHKDVFYNIAFPALGTRGKRIEDLRTEVYSLAKKLGIAHCLARNIEELSIGQQELVSIGKSLIKKPDVLLLDEPFASLDAPRRAEIGKLIKEWGIGNHATIIYVGHSPSEGIQLANRFYLMGQGELLFSGTLDELKKSPSPSAMEFLSYWGRV